MDNEALEGMFTYCIVHRCHKEERYAVFVY